MQPVMYLDCFSGAAGDMLLGALIDAGLPADRLKEALGSLGVEHELVVTRVMRAGVSATKVDVRAPDHHVHGRTPHDHGHATGYAHAGEDASHGHRTLAEIAQLIDRSALSPRARTQAVSLFTRIGEAEAAVHGVSLDAVHLHEVGAVDSIVDIVGVVFGMEWFGIEDIVASPLNVGGGTVEMAHGRFPVPPPATVALLRGAPIYNAGPDKELVTPTGALLVTGYARAFGNLPAMVVDRIGYGAGTRDFPGRPNVVRILVGHRADDMTEPRGREAVVKIECEIDDMNPQLFGPASEALLAAGALDVFLTPVQMKKGRPGTLLTVLVPEEARQAMTEVIFRETTTIGLRFVRMWRDTLDRRWDSVTLPDGPVRIKIAERAGTILSAAPEFDDCLRVARGAGVPVREIQARALEAWRAQAGIE